MSGSDFCYSLAMSVGIGVLVIEGTGHLALGVAAMGAAVLIVLIGHAICEVIRNIKP